MAKRFRLKISRVFTSCRSKDPSDLPSNPVPSFPRISSVNPNPTTLHLPPQPQPQPQPTTTSSKMLNYSSLKRHVSSAFSSIGCGLRSRSSAKYFSESDRTEPLPPLTPEFHWEKEDRWHVIAKVNDDDETPCRRIYNTSDDDIFPPLPTPSAVKKKRRYRKKKTIPKIRISTSSADSGLFSSESFDDEEDNIIKDEETETLVSSSRSFSTDSSSETYFNSNLETIRETMPGTRHYNKTKKKSKKVNRNAAKRYVSKRLSSSSTESESPARLSNFLQRMIPCTVLDGRVRESFVVVKKSEDPYEDFKRSMMEMILEKQIFEDKDLEQLLKCFLSLNSRHHHGAIARAFTEIWEALFSPSSTSTTSRVSCALKSTN